MTKETLEHLSCLMDGELSPEAGRFLARRMGSDETLGATWQRYHLIRDCLRRPGESLTMTRLTVDLDRVDQDLDASAPASGKARWLRPVAGTAIAASVAAAAVFLSLGIATGPVATPTNAEPFASPNTAGLTPPVSQPASLNADAAASQRTLNSYVLRHNQMTGVVRQQGFVSFVPIVVGKPVQVAESDDGAAEPSTDDESTGDR